MSISRVPPEKQIILTVAIQAQRNLTYNLSENNAVKQRLIINFSYEQFPHPSYLPDLSLNN